MAEEKKTSNAVKILKKRYIGDSPERQASYEIARLETELELVQARIDAKLELEMPPIRKENEKATVHAFMFGMPLIGLLIIVKYGILPLILL